MISGFRREVGENWVLLGYYTVPIFFLIFTRVPCIFYYFVL